MLNLWPRLKASAAPTKSSTSVWVGFALLLTLTGVLAIDSSTQSRQVASKNAALRRESRERDALLDELRTNFFRSGTLVKDYLAARDGALAARHAGELRRSLNLIRTTLHTYGQKALPEIAVAGSLFRQRLLTI